MIRRGGLRSGRYFRGTGIWCRRFALSSPTVIDLVRHLRDTDIIVFNPKYFITKTYLIQSQKDVT
jgi:hypothetical protein